MKIKTTMSEKLGTFVRTVFLILIGLITLYPFLNVLAVSLSDSTYILQGAVGILPKGFNTVAYSKIWESGYLFGAYKNTIFVTLFTTVLGVLITAFTAYPLSRNHLRGRKILTVLITLTMWFNAGTVPMFLVMQKLGLLDKLWGLILAHMLTAYNVVVMKSFFVNVPESLIESAKLDGCNDLGVLFKIVLPLSKAVLSTVALWIAVAQWNSFFEPMLFLQSKSKFTLQIILRDIVLDNSSTEYGLNPDEGMVVGDAVKYATVIVATLPILCVYPFIQKYFVKGVMLGSVKG